MLQTLGCRFSDLVFPPSPLTFVFSAKNTAKSINFVPLPQKDIRRIEEAVAPLDYGAMFGAFGRYIRSGAREAMSHSVDRYLKVFR